MFIWSVCVHIDWGLQQSESHAIGFVCDDTGRSGRVPFVFLIKLLRGDIFALAVVLLRGVRLACAYWDVA